MKYKYVGDKSLITKCNFRKEDCDELECPGEIEGDCPFKEDCTLNHDYEKYFEVVDE